LNTLRLLLCTVLCGVLVTACRVPIETGPSIAEPGTFAAALRHSTGAAGPAFLRFEWFYGDRRGDVRGEGVARYNPTDSLRLDLFTAGEVAMAVALAGHQLSSGGGIDDVELPSGPLLFAMAGLFRPEPGADLEAYVAGSDTVLVTTAGPDRKLYFFARGGRLDKVEERNHGRLLRKVALVWSADLQDWPEQAEFRDFGEHSRVRWTIDEIRVLEERHSSDIFALPYLD
jgi:hypothetical protein